MTQPNAASMGLHRALGFTYHRIGWKNGGWHDVTWLELDLAPDEDTAVAPAELTTGA